MYDRPRFYQAFYITSEVFFSLSSDENKLVTTLATYNVTEES